MKIDREFAALCPPLQVEELAMLEENMIAEGCREPLCTWRGWLLDGHHRERICREHKIKYETREISLPDRAAALVWIIKNQFGRRNLTPMARSELALKLEPLIAAKAKERMVQGGKEKGVQISAHPKTRLEVAKLAGVSHDTIRKAKVLIEKADRETLDKLRKGETTINREFQKAREPDRFAKGRSEQRKRGAKIREEHAEGGRMSEEFKKLWEEVKQECIGARNEDFAETSKVAIQECGQWLVAFTKE